MAATTKAGAGTAGAAAPMPVGAAQAAAVFRTLGMGARFRSSDVGRKNSDAPTAAAAAAERDWVGRTAAGYGSAAAAGAAASLDFFGTGHSTAASAAASKAAGKARKAADGAAEAPSTKRPRPSEADELEGGGDSGGDDYNDLDDASAAAEPGLAAEADAEDDADVDIALATTEEVCGRGRRCPTFVWPSRLTVASLGACGTVDNQVNAFRNRYRIRVSGTDVPEPITGFQNLQLKYGCAADRDAGAGIAGQQSAGLVRRAATRCRYKLRPFLQKALAASSYVKPTPIQMQAVPAMLCVRSRRRGRGSDDGTALTRPPGAARAGDAAHLKGREVLAVAPTGSGKTLAYTLPILHSLKACVSERGRYHGQRAHADVLPRLTCGADCPPPPRRRATRRACVRW